MTTTNSFDVYASTHFGPSTDLTLGSKLLLKLKNIFQQKKMRKVPSYLLARELYSPEYKSKYAEWLAIKEAKRIKAQRDLMLEYVRFEDRDTSPLDNVPLAFLIKRHSVIQELNSIAQDVAEADTISVRSVETLTPSICGVYNTLRLYGGGDRIIDVPMITQRVIKNTRYRKDNTPIKRGCSNSFKRTTLSTIYERNEINVHKQEHIENLLNYSDDCDTVINKITGIKFYPQMNFMPHMNVNLNCDDELVEKLNKLSISLQDGIKVSHGIDPQTSKVVSELTEMLRSKTSLLNTDINFKLPNFDYTKVGIIVASVAAALVHYNKRDHASLTILLGLLSAGILTQSFLSVAGVIPLMSYLSTYVVKYTKSSAPDHVQMEDIVVPQMNLTDFENIVSSLVMIMITILVGKSDKPWTKEIINHVLNYKRSVDSVSSCFSAILKVVETIANYVSRDILGGSSFTLLETNRSDVNEFLAKVRVINDQVHHGTFLATTANSKIIHELWMEANELMSKLNKGTEAGIMVSLSNAISWLLSVKKSYEGMNLTFSGSRAEPTAALFLGPPGVGKSNMLYPLAYKLISETIPESKRDHFINSPNTFIYNRQAECVYWDGYNMDKIVCFIDDLGQMRDIAGNPDNEWMNWIRMCSSFNYVLHMASLEKKGNVYFQSRFVIANSNMQDFHVESIVEIEAFKRRVDHCFVVCPKEEFTKPETLGRGIWNRRLDGSKLPLGPLGITELTPEVAEFHEYNLLAHESKYTGKVFTYEEVAQMMLKTADLKQLRYEQMQMYLNKATFDAPVPQGLLDRARKGKMWTYDCKRFKNFMDKILKHEDSSDCITYLIAHYHQLTGQDHTLEYIIDFFYKYYGDIFEIFTECNPDDYMRLLENGFDPISEVDKCYPQMQKTDILSKLLKSFEGAYKTISTKLLECGAGWITTYKSMLDRFWFIIEPVSILVSVCVTAKIFHYIIKNIFSGILSLFGSPFSTEAYSGKPQRERGNKASRKALNPKSYKSRLNYNQPSIQPSTQSASKYDAANVDIVKKIVMRNCYELWLPDQDKRLGFATFVRGQTFMIPRHFATQIYYAMDDFPDYETKLVTFKKTNSKITYQMKMCEMMNVVSDVGLDNLDCVLVKAPKYFPTHADITPYFVSRDRADKMRDIHYRLVMPGVEECTSWMGDARKIESQVITDDVTYTLLKGFRYFALTQNGDCGALFTVVDTHTQQEKILGMHVAGNPSVGFGISSCITREDMLTDLNPVNEVIQKFEDESYPQSETIVLDGRFETKYISPFRTSAGGRTKIIRSPLHGKWMKANKAPSKLSSFQGKDGQVVNVLNNALEAYCTPFVYVEPKIVEDIGDMIYDNLNYSSSITVDKKLLTFKEAVCGIENEPDFAAISRSTSLGYPEAAAPGPKPKGKKAILGETGEYTYDSAECQKIIEECKNIESLAKQNIRSEHIYIDKLKDELRSHAKVEAGKTRLFSSCPFRLLILFRRYFGSYLLWLHKNRIENGFAVGVNPFSAEWQRLAYKLLQFGTPETKNIGAGDFKGYDGKEKPIIHNDILRIVNKWYSDEHSLVREVLWLEITNSHHISDSIIYAWPSSNPSGNPMTTAINNLYNHYTAAYVWYKVHDFNLLDLRSFYKNVYYVTLGDDNAFAVSHDKTHLFNEKAMSDHVPDLGMTYTNEHKTETTADLRSIDQISFLKRSFRYEEFYDRYCAPLELEVILEIPFWTKDTSDSNAIVDDNVNTAIRELSLHPPEVFNEWVDKICSSYLSECGKAPRTTSRRHLLLECANADTWY